MQGADRGKLNWGNLRRGLSLAFNVVRVVGLRSDYRRPFWRAFRYALRRGQIDGALGMGFVGHHLIQFSREAVRGEQNASFYAAQARAASPESEPAQRARQPVRAPA